MYLDVDVDVPDIAAAEVDGGELDINRVRVDEGALDLLYIVEGKGLILCWPVLERPIVVANQSIPLKHDNLLLGLIKRTLIQHAIGDIFEVTHLRVQIE